MGPAYEVSTGPSGEMLRSFLAITAPSSLPFASELLTQDHRSLVLKQEALRLLSGLDRFENFVTVVFDFYVGPDLGDFAGRRDEEGDA